MFLAFLSLSACVYLIKIFLICLLLLKSDTAHNMHLYNLWLACCAFHIHVVHASAFFLLEHGDVFSGVGTASPSRPCWQKQKWSKT